MKIKCILSAVLLSTLLRLSCSAQPKDIDKLCPPRPETAATYHASVSPSAVRGYRQAALMAFDYIMSLPDMTCLPETGDVYRLYQHNAYVSKTHAAHIRYMLFLAEEEPSRKEEAMRFAKASAEYLLNQLEPADAPLAYWPPTYIRKPLDYFPEIDGPRIKMAMIGNEPEGAVKFREEVMLLYPASVGTAFLEYYGVSHDSRFLDAAKGIADTYVRIRRKDGSWPLKMKLITAEPLETNVLVPTDVLFFFRELADVTADSKWRNLEYSVFSWIEKYSLSDWNWDGQFEDVEPAAKYKNPTKHNAIDVMLYMMERFPNDHGKMKTCRNILDFCEKRFVVWEAPANHPSWPAPSVLEQYSCFTPIDSSASKLIFAYMAAYKQFGRKIYLQKAKALANTVTRVQEPSGRIPTFWESLDSGEGLSDKRYDWLNCMEYTASTLMLLDRL